MAHNLRTNAEGQTCMAYTGDTPWHQLGTPCAEAMTSAEAIQAAHLDFTVIKEDLFLADGTKAPACCTRTSDTKELLGIVGLNYESPQPVEAFEFFDDLMGQGVARFVTAGALGKGEKIWLLAKMPETLEVVAGDAIETYILLSNSYDMSSNLEARYTSIRVVCQNTLAMATSGNPAVVKLRHTKNIKSRMAQAAMVLQGYQDHLGQFSDCLKRLQKVRITDELLTQFEISMFGNIEDTPEGRGRTMLANNLTKFEQLVFTGRGTEIPGVVGTLYGVLNAYTEWSDYYSMVKGDEGRTGAIVFGNAAKKKQEAFALAMAMAR